MYDRFERHGAEAWQNSKAFLLPTNPGSTVNRDIKVQVGCQTRMFMVNGWLRRCRKIVRIILVMFQIGSSVPLRASVALLAATCLAADCWISTS